MRELGVDLSGAVPRRLSYDDAEAADLVVTMGCGDACPVVPGTAYEDWALDDPAGQGPEVVRRVRDEIRGRVDDLVGRLDRGDVTGGGQPASGVRS